MPRKSKNYVLLPDEILDRKMKKQQSCTHPRYITRCSCCDFIISSDALDETTHHEEVLI